MRTLSSAMRAFLVADALVECGLLPGVLLEREVEDSLGGRAAEAVEGRGKGLAELSAFCINPSTSAKLVLSAIEFAGVEAQIGGSAGSAYEGSVGWWAVACRERYDADDSGGACCFPP